MGKNKLSELERKLERSNTMINELNWKYRDVLKGREQEVLKNRKLDALCMGKEMELKSLQEQLLQKDDELEHHRRKSTQPSPNASGLIQQHIPAASSHGPISVRQHIPTASSNNPISVQQHSPAATQQNHCYPALKCKNSEICNSIYPILMSLQDNQQKVCVIINNLYDRMMTYNASGRHYPNFNSKEEPYNTDQKN